MFKKLWNALRGTVKEEIIPPEGYQIRYNDQVIVAVNKAGDTVQWIPGGMNNENKYIPGFWKSVWEDGTGLTPVQMSRFIHWYYE